MLYNRCTGIYKFGNNAYPRRIRRRSKLGHILGGKKCVLWTGKYGTCLAAEVLLQPWIFELYALRVGQMAWYLYRTLWTLRSFAWHIVNVGTGKSRYGICVNFYRPMERVPPGGCLGGARGDRHSSTFRRESWRKSIEKSSDSAFSRLVTHPFQRLAGLYFPLNFKSCTVFVWRQVAKKNSVHYTVR